MSAIEKLADAIVDAPFVLEGYDAGFDRVELLKILHKHLAPAGMCDFCEREVEDFSDAYCEDCSRCR